MYLLAKYGTQTTFTFPMVKRGVVDLAVTGDWTPAAADSSVSKDAGNWADTTNTVAIAGTSGTRGATSWKITLTAAELTAAVIDLQIVDAATKAVEDQYIKIYTYGNASAKIPVDLSDTVRLGLTALPNAAASAFGGLPVAVDTSGRVDVLKVNGTTQTARDLGASVLLSPGTGTGQVDITSGVIKANLVQILGTALTETAGFLAAAFKKFFNVATPTSQADNLPLNTDYTSARATKLDNLDATISSRSTLGGTAQTGDAYARLGAPAGASVSADIAAIKTEEDAIKAKTDLIPASPAAVSDIPTAASNASALLASTVETGATVKESLRIANAANAGKVDGAATTTMHLRDLADTKNRVTATVDASGNRSAISTDLT